MASIPPGKFSAKDVPSLAGEIAIVTGGSDGIGYVTALELAAHGAKVYILSRSSEKAEAAIIAMKKSKPGQNLDLHFLRAGLQDLRSVLEVARRFQDTESKLHILIANAGIMAAPYALTTDGFETQWQTNYLSHFLLIKTLLPTLMATAAESDRVRIVCVSSDAAFVPLAPDLDLESPNLEQISGVMAAWKRYCHSKAALVLLVHALHTRFLSQKPPLAIKSYALNPGVIETNLQSVDPTLLGRTIKFAVRWGLVPGKVKREDGARTTLACATSDQSEIVEGSGGYFGIFGKRDAKGDALVEKYKGKDIEQKLWQASERMLREKGFGV